MTGIVIAGIIGATATIIVSIIGFISAKEARSEAAEARRAETRATEAANKLTADRDAVAALKSAVESMLDLNEVKDREMAARDAQIAKLLIQVEECHVASDAMKVQLATLTNKIAELERVK